MWKKVGGTWKHGGSADDTHPQGRSQNGCKELCNVQLSIVEHVKQRTWLLNKKRGPYPEV